MINLLKCGTGSYRNAALTVAIIDTIFTSILLILFVLGSSVLVAFEFVGGTANATRALDEITDDVLGQTQQNYTNSRQSKDVAEDLGVYLIFMYLALVDFIISYVFLDGVRSKNIGKCQIWLSVRVVIICIFFIVVIFNIINGTSWSRYSAELVFALYRVTGLLIGYGYFRELRAFEACGNCNCQLRRPNSVPSGENKRHSIINLGFRRKEVKKSMVLEPPILTITGPEDAGRTTPLYSIASAQNSPRIGSFSNIHMSNEKL